MGDLNWFWLVEVMGFVHERGTQTPPPGSRQFVSFRFVFRARVFEVVGFACLLACLLGFFFFFFSRRLLTMLVLGVFGRRGCIHARGYAC